MEYTTTKGLSEAEETLETVLFYQGYDDILIDNYLRILNYKNHPNAEYIRHETLIMVDGEKTPIIKALGQDIWCFIIALYGEWGVSLRCGWIENIEGFINLIEHMIIWSDYGVVRPFKERSITSNEPIECATLPLAEYMKHDLLKICTEYNIDKMTFSEMIEFIEKHTGDGKMKEILSEKPKYDNRTLKEKVNKTFSDHLQPTYRWR